MPSLQSTSSSRVRLKATGELAPPASQRRQTVTTIPVANTPSPAARNACCGALRLSSASADASMASSSYQSGTVRIEAGKRPTTTELETTDYLVEGVTGNIPK